MNNEDIMYGAFVAPNADGMENMSGNDKVKAGLILSSKDVGSRQQLNQRLGLLPKEVIKALQEGKAQVSDAVYYATREIRSKTGKIELIQSQDRALQGITNLNSAEIDTNRYFLPTKITLLYGTVLGATPFGSNPFDQVGNADFDALNLPDYIKNGEWEFRVGGKILIGNMSARTFSPNYINRQTGAVAYRGEFNLDNPKLIYPKTKLEFNVNTVDTTAFIATGIPALNPVANDRYYLRVELVGSEVRSF